MTNHPAPGKVRILRKVRRSRSSEVHPVPSKVLVYDAESRVCYWLTRIFIGLGLVPNDCCKGFQEFPHEQHKVLLRAGIRNEMVVFSGHNGHVRAGVPGLLWLFEDSWAGWLGEFFSHALPRDFANFALRLLTLNRRIFFPPEPGWSRNRIDPDPHPGYHLFLIGISLLLGVLLTGLLGVAMASATGRETAAMGALKMQLVAGSGWWGMLLLGLVAVPGSARLAYWGNLALTQVVGLVLLLPAMASAWWLEGIPFLSVLGVFSLISFMLMWKMLRRRLEHLQLARGLVPVWLIFVLAGMIGWPVFWYAL